MFKTISIKKVFKSIIFDITEEKFEGPQGQSTYHYVNHPGAVMIIPQDEDGKFHMIRQYRHPIHLDILEFPAGLIEQNEHLDACAQRELQEEINKAAHNMDYLGKIYTVPGYSDEVIHIFKATNLYDAILPKDKNEIIVVEKYTLAEIKQLVQERKIVDAKTLAALPLLGL